MSIATPGNIGGGIGEGATVTGGGPGDGGDGVEGGDGGGGSSSGEPCRAKKTRLCSWSDVTVNS